MSEQPSEGDVGQRARWRLEYLVYRGFETVIGWLPPAAVAKTGSWMGGVAHRFLAGRRRAVERNLRIAFAGEKSPAEIAALTRDVFRRTGANLVSSLHTATLRGAALDAVIRVENPELFQEAVREGRGVVMILAHMGNWEALAQQFPRLLPAGFKGATVYRPLNNPLINARVEATRAQEGVELYSKRHSPLAMSSFLRAGGTLGILSDQRAGNSGEFVPFFGRLTSCTPLPSILARRTKSAVMAVSLRTEAPGRWCLKVHRLRGEPTTAACMRLLEEVMRVSPADVFWFQERWRPGRRSPFVQSGRLSAAHAGETGRGRRALVWLDEDAREAPALPECAPQDVRFEYCVAGDGVRPAWLSATAVVHGRGVREKAPEARGLAAVLKRIDEGDSVPLECVVAVRKNAAAEAACELAGLRWVVMKSVATP